VTATGAGMTLGVLTDVTLATPPPFTVTPLPPPATHTASHLRCFVTRATGASDTAKLIKSTCTCNSYAIPDLLWVGVSLPSILCCAAFIHNCGFNNIYESDNSDNLRNCNSN